jgi:hypothetical protein
MKSEKQLNDEQNELILREAPVSGIQYFAAVGKFKSVRRAMKRGLLTEEGIIMPKRPFNNKANTSKRKRVHSRTFNEKKKDIYKELRKYGKRFEYDV